MKRALMAVVLGLAMWSAPLSAAGPDRVRYPEGFASGFLLYNKVDRPDRKRVRFMYVNRSAHAQARPGAPLPDGTILVMEDHEIALDAQGNPVLDRDGRLAPTDKVTAVFVMEKRRGWGETNHLPPDKDNGDWDYAWYEPNGQPRNVSMDGCYACHTSRASRDFTFTYFKNLQDGQVR